MKIPAAACFALLSGLSVAGGGDAMVQTPWFDETYTSFKVERADKWVTDAGAWRRSATDQTVFSNQVMHLDTRGNDFLLEPGPYRTSTKNQAVAVTSRMTFVACRDGEEWSYTNATPHAPTRAAARQRRLERRSTKSIKRKNGRNHTPLAQKREPAVSTAKPHATLA